MSTQASARLAPRLNPFAFPSGTDSWFVLLVVSVVGATTFVYNWLATFLPLYTSGLLEAVQGCRELARTAAQELGRAAADPLIDQTAQLQATQAYFDCNSRFYLGVALASLSGLPLLALVAGAVYWLMPRWIIRRRGLVALDREDAADVLAELADLSQQAGLPRPPRFLGAPGWASTDALAFGRYGQRFVGLDQGLITQFYAQPDRFRAVVLHELAHLRNGDVDKAYLVVAFTLAFVIVGLVPLAVSLVGQPLDLVLGLGLRGAGLLALVALTGAAVLRARESYADVRASTWTATGAAALTCLFTAQPKGQRRGLRHLLRLHLDAAERSAVLADTSPLLRASAAEALATGVAVALVLPRITSTVSALVTGRTDSVVNPTVAALVLGPLVMGIVGLGIWRAVFASLAAGGRPPACGRAAMALALGLVVGQFLTFDAPFEPVDAPPLVTVRLLWGALVAVTVYGFLRWVAAGARAWLLVTAGQASPKLAYVCGLGLAALVLIAGLAALVEVNELAVTGLGSGGRGALSALPAFGFGVLAGLFVLFQLPVTVLAVIGVWAYPLAARYWPRRVARVDEPFWAFLGPARRPVLPMPGREGLRLALRAALAVSVVCWVVCLLAYVQYRGQPEAVRALPTVKIQLYSTLVVVSVVLEAVAAALVTWRAPVLKAAHGLLAAFLTGCLATAGMDALVVLFGGSLDLQFVSNTFSLVVVMGGLVAMLVAGLTFVVAVRQVPRLQTVSPEPEPWLASVPGSTGSWTSTIPSTSANMAPTTSG